MTQLKTPVLLTMQAMECPFCGGANPELIAESVDSGIKFRVSCMACSANGPSADSAEQALERWNWTGKMDA